MKAPVRDVVRVLEVDGERGGRMLVCILSCGCFVTKRLKVPPKRTPCIACFVKEQIDPTQADGQLGEERR